jgi:uncharacterized protein
MNRKPTVFLIFLLQVCFFTSTISQAKGKINLLLLSGKNNHEWHKTTPKLQEIYIQSNLFSVTVTEQPDTLSELSLKPFQVIVSNWNSWPEKNCTWTESTKKAIQNFINNGKGIVFVHSAGSANYDWPDYQSWGAASWGDSTKHGKVDAFQVKFIHSNCPVTKGFSDFQTNDELWVNSRITGSSIVLAEAFAPVENSGSGELEPILFCGKSGKGRTFSTLLGHNEQAMNNPGFQTLLLRGTEWVAIGKVTQKIPEGLKLK